MKNKWLLVPIVVLGFILASEVIWYVPYTPSKGSSLQILHVTSTENAITVRFQLHADLSTDATVVAVPVVSEPQDLPVYIFYDEDYTTKGVGPDWFLIRRLWEHLKVKLMLRDYSTDVRLVDDMELENIFLSNKLAIVIMAYGAFPSNVFSWERNLVKPWIESGGTLIWLGWEMGYYTIDKEQENMTCEMPNQLHLEGLRRLGVEELLQITAGGPYWVDAEHESVLSNALDIRYNQIRCAPLLEKVILLDGLALGKVGKMGSSTRVSVSAISIGKGKVVLFGFFIRNAAEEYPLSYYSVARDIAQILCSGVLQMSPDFEVGYQSYRLSYRETQIDNCTISMKPDMKGVVLYGYNSIESTGLLFFREYIPL